ncbi:MAG: TylF/MycF/NovP-related O-methyltransferase [Candidatus Sedimenticola sp. 20ELBAFRAG]
MGEHLFGFNTDDEWDHENGFYLTSHPTRVAKLLAQYELYKSIVNLPGHVVECGVYKGASLIRLAAFRDSIENQYSRKLVGFDTFGVFPKPDNPTDAEFVEGFVDEGGEGIPVDELRRVLARKSYTNVELVKGDILETVPQYVADRDELKIALLHIDVDVYEPTKVILEQMFDRVVTGGVIVLDDYGAVSGETSAVDEFIQGKGLVVEKLPISHSPPFIRKN